MVFFAKNRIIFSISIVFLIGLIATAAIFWARGFKPNFRDGTIDRTGLLVVSSVPTGASVFLDDRLTSATDTTIAFLDPKTYSVRIEKDGFSVWEKQIDIVADLSTEIKALLFPLAPEIKPLTTTGASSPTLSPDSSKLVYGTTGERGGLFILPMTSSPLPFRQNAKQIADNTASFDFSQGKFIWGPNSSELIAQFTDEDGKVTANLLLNANENNQELRDITASLTSTLSAWQEELNANAQTQAITIPDAVKEATSTAKSEVEPLINYFPTGLNFSPNEDKVFYQDKDGIYKVFDLTKDTETTLPAFEDLINLSWYPDSNHLVVAQTGKISIIEADGNNNMTVFTGSYENGFVFAHPSGNQLIVLTTLTQQESTPPNLYAVVLR